MGPQLCGPDQRKCYDDATVHERIRVLVVDDDPEVRSLLGRVLTKSSWSTTEASSGADAMATLGRQEFDVVLLDVKLPDASGLDILRWARESDVDTEFVILTGNADVETAVEAMRLGAYDFVAKPWRNAELVQVIGKAAEKKDLRRENHALKEVMTRRDGMPHIVGDSPEIVDVVSMIARVAASDSPVLINGESGTGKELVARSVHLKSRRASRPFVSVNCGALPDTLLETELFGHKRGAFSGAVNSRVGLFEAADGGTLFLDEIGEMSPALQVRLLRVLDSGEGRLSGGGDGATPAVRVAGQHPGAAQPHRAPADPPRGRRGAGERAARRADGRQAHSGRTRPDAARLAPGDGAAVRRARAAIDRVEQ